MNSNYQLKIVGVLKTSKGTCLAKCTSDISSVEKHSLRTTLLIKLINCIHLNCSTSIGPGCDELGMGIIPFGSATRESDGALYRFNSLGQLLHHCHLIPQVQVHGWLTDGGTGNTLL